MILEQNVTYNDDQSSFCANIDGTEDFIFHSTEAQYTLEQPPVLVGSLAKYNLCDNAVGETLERRVRVAFVETPTFKMRR